MAGGPLVGLGGMLLGTCLPEDVPRSLAEHMGPCQAEDNAVVADEHMGPFDAEDTVN